MNNRGLALAVFVLAALLCGVALFTLRDAQASAAELEPAAEAPSSTPTEIESVQQLQDRAPTQTRRATDTQASREPLEQGDGEIIEHAVADGAVLVEVRVMAPDEVEPLSPHPYAGGTVHTQSWDEDTHETQHHEAPIDSDGIARFRFPGAVHLDWFRAQTPIAAGYASAFGEYHENIPAGAVFRAAIQTVPGGRVFGQVTTLSGSPLSGVEVSAYLENDGVRDNWTDDWYPGHFTTTSGAGGVFEFEALPAGDLSVFVRPGEWLQITPDYDGSFNADMNFELEAGAAHDAGVLKLARRARLDVRVVDAAGRPAVQAQLELSPVAFDDPALVAQRDWERRFEPEQLLEDEGIELDDALLEELRRVAEVEARTTPIWPDGASSAVTDDKGKARCNVVEGLWDLVVVPQLGDEFDEVRRRVRTPGEEVVVTLATALVDVEGAVVDEITRAPVGNVSVQIRVGPRSQTTGANANGRFRFESVRLAGAYELWAQRGEYFPTKKEYASTELEPVVELHTAAQLIVRVRDVHATSLPTGIVKLAGARLDPQVASDARALAWLARPELSLDARAVSRSGVAAFAQIWPGEYDVTYSVPIATGQFGEWGEPLSTPQVVQSWKLHTGAKPQDAFIDLAAVAWLEPARYGTLNVLVLDAETGAPIEHADIEVVHALRTRTFTTSESGAYSIGMPIGQVTVTVRHAEFEPLDAGAVEVGGRRVARTWKLLRRR